MINIEENKTYIGVVENNNDPKKLGRIKVRVLDVFDDISSDDIPWASPWKDLNGNGFNLPEKGKIVTVIFDQGNLYKPEFLYSEHYNINLEKKLQNLDSKDYTSMKSVFFDHKTQFFVNDKDGVVLDYKINQINIRDNGIDMNLKDNMGTINIGSGNANQQAILGTNFLNWFDEFVDNLLNGPYLGNLLAPVVANSSFIDILMKYKALKDPKFLSKNVNLNDNGYIDAAIIPTQDTRVTDGQVGDSWKSTVKKNELVMREPITFKPKAAVPISGNLTPASASPSGGESQPITQPGTPTGPPITADNVPPASKESNPDANGILNALRKKKYVVYEKPWEMNIVGVRYQYPGQGYSNKFIDRLYLVYKNDDGATKCVWYPISTMPGRYGDKSYGKTLHKDIPKIKARGGLGILKPAQYIGSWYISEYHGAACLKPGTQKFYRDAANGDEKITFSMEGERPDTGMLIHKAYMPGSGKNTYGVFNWSEGCQVIPDPAHLEQFFSLLDKHKVKYGNKFTYTLITSKDVEDAESAGPIANSGSTTSTPPSNTPVSPADQKSFDEYQKIVKLIENVYRLGDTNYTPNSKALFQDFKGFSDDVNGAANRLYELLGLKTMSVQQTWYNKLPITKLTAEHQKLFKDQLASLKKATIDKNNGFKFNLPTLKKGEGQKSIGINADF